LGVAKPRRPRSAAGAPEQLQAVVVTDHEGRVAAWTAAAEELTGLSAAEMIGEPAWEICTQLLPAGQNPEAVRRRVKTMVELALSTGQRPALGRSVYRLRRPDGVEKMIEHDLDVLRDGERYQLLVTARDVTPPAPEAGPPLSDETEFHRFFTEMLGGAAIHEIICDDSGKPVDYRFLEVNPAFEALTGLKRADIIGKRVLEVIPSIEPEWIERYGRVALTGRPEQFESYNAALGRYYEVKAYSQAPGRFAVMFHDVTPLRERSAFVETIVSSAGEGIVVYDRELRVVVWNPVMEELTGLSADQVVGRLAFDAFPEVMAAGVGDDLRQALTADVPTSREFEFVIPRTGRRGWAVQTNRPHRSAVGEIVGVVSSVRDITAKHEVEEATRRSEDEFRMIFDNVGDAVAISDPEGRFLEVNRVLCERLGYTREQLLSMSVDSINSPATAALVPERTARILARGAMVFESAHVRADGTTVPIEGVARKVEFRGKTAILTVQRDISERKQSEAAMAEQARLLQQLIDAIPVPIIAKGIDGRIQLLNSAFAEAAGPHPQFIGKTVGELGMPEPAMHTERDRIVLSGGPTQIYEISMPWSDGTVRRQLLTKAALRAADGTTTGVVTASLDIDDRYQAEQALRRSEERFRTLFESAGDLIFMVDPTTGKPIEVNRTACDRLGYSREELLSLSPFDLALPDYAGGVEERLELLAERGDLRFETALIRRDGAPVPVDMSLTTVEIEGRPTLLGIARDISDRKKAEEDRTALENQLRQAQKMEGIGRLAGGIAHDFNNLLTAIRGNASLALIELPPDHPAREDLEQIEQAADRAAALTRQLVAFARRTVLQPEVVDLSLIVRRLEPMLRRLIGEDVLLETVAPDGAGRVIADPGQIEQVIVNLAVNSADAMPDGGKLTIVVAEVLAEDDPHVDPAAPAGPTMMLSVADTGIGMDDTILEHLFEPFFTTKDPSKGTGLGLATVYGIVQMSGGTVTVRSEVGHGSTLSIYLPRVEAGAGADPEPPRWSPAGSTRSGTILVVEDDSGVRRFASRVLEGAGYSVVTAPDGPTALGLSADIHVQMLLTDVVMPGMSGRDVAARLASTRPGLRILYMSGHTDKGIVHDGILEPGIEFLAKPFTAETLLAAVDAVMAQETGH
jgi:two-component system, cell cycle sensor histidine kinase and response regulator CckA